MAILYNLPRVTLDPGPVLSNHNITPPANTDSLAYRLSVGDPLSPKVENVVAWVEVRDTDNRWREVSRFVFTYTGSSVGLVKVRGSAMRFSVTCGTRTTASVFVETLAAGEEPTPDTGGPQTPPTTTPAPMAAPPVTE